MLSKKLIQKLLISCRYVYNVRKQKPNGELEKALKDIIWLKFIEQNNKIYFWYIHRDNTDIPLTVQLSNQ